MLNRLSAFAIFAVLALASALLLVTLASPEARAFQGPPPGMGAMGPGGEGWGPGHGRGGPGHLNPGFLMRLADKLELSQEQIDQIEALHESHRAEVEPVWEELRSVRQSLRELSAEGGFFANEAEITRLASEQGDLTAQLTVSRERFKAELLSVLTEEQRQELKELMELGRSFRGSRRGPRRGPPGGGN